MSADARYTPSDVAARYGVSRHFVEKRVREKKWPHLRVGKFVRFTDAHLEQIDALYEVPVAPEVAAQKSWGRKTRGGAA